MWSSAGPSKRSTRLLLLARLDEYLYNHPHHQKHDNKQQLQLKWNYKHNLKHQKKRKE